MQMESFGVSILMWSEYLQKEVVVWEKVRVDSPFIYCIVSTLIEKASNCNQGFNLF